MERFRYLERTRMGILIQTVYFHSLSSHKSGKSRLKFRMVSTTVNSNTALRTNSEHKINTLSKSHFTKIISDLVLFVQHDKLVCVLPY